MYLSTDVERSEAVLQTAKALGISENAALGHLVILWGGVARHYDDGNLGDDANEPWMTSWLEDVGRWRGEPGVFARAVREYCMKDGKMMPDGKVVRWRNPYSRSGLPRPPIPAMLRRAVYKRDGYRCANCGSDERLSLDHIEPFSRGGADTYENLRTLCTPCNSRRGAARCDF